MSAHEIDLLGRPVPAPTAPSRDPYPFKVWRFRARADAIDGLGFTRHDVARACGFTPRMFASILAHGCSNASARRLVAGLRRLTGMPLAAGLVVEDLLEGEDA